MELFAKIGDTQKMDYSQQTKQTTQPTKKIDETDKINKDKQTSKNQDIEEQHKLTKKELEKITKELNKEMSPLNPDIKFSFNNKIDELVVNVIDKNTDKVIRKIPSEDALKIMEKMKEFVGALFDKKG